MAATYYQILEIPADADLLTIKKSFRKLAMQYHPDKSTGNSFSQAHYLLIQEAYQTLTNPELRKAYDTELWLSQKKTFYQGQALTPALMIKRLQRLAEAVMIQKQFHILEDHLAAFLLDAMNEVNSALFQARANENEQEVFADYIIFLGKDLPKPFRDEVFDRLSHTLGQQLNDIELKISSIQQQKRSADWYQKNIFWLLLCIGVLICLLMYFYAKTRH
ncbi:MAG: hypothetical protein BGO31_09345 [Bacteroidetes bacterium 43-16]|nr:MAG: hypothetical protein BGO31_09345 [Bacteroidetes bacterium 43-16]